MSCEKTTIIDYQLISTKKIHALLAQGYQPYGSPVAANTKNNELELLQAVIKERVTSFQNTINSNEILEPLEKNCILARIQGISYKEMAKKFNKSEQTIRNRFAEMRRRFNCKSSEMLAVKLVSSGCIDPNKVLQNKK